MAKKPNYFGIKSTKSKTNTKIFVSKSGLILGSGSIFGSTVKCPYFANITMNLF
jgi:hypothetical protein